VLRHPPVKIPQALLAPRVSRVRGGEGCLTARWCHPQACAILVQGLAPILQKLQEGLQEGQEGGVTWPQLAGAAGGTMNMSVTTKWEAGKPHLTLTLTLTLIGGCEAPRGALESGGDHQRV
jgi:hypothetical protein